MPGDAHELEADRVAEQVMRMPGPRVHCACGGACPRCRTEPPGHGHVQRTRVQARDTGRVAAPPVVHEVLAGSGRPLAPATRAFFEPRFGRDFRDVRIHTGDRAGTSARAVDARAYTVGRDVVFAPGEFAPDTDTGRRLLAHELVHVVQQTSGGAPEIARVPTKSGARKGRYTYSTNCGWIDWGHASPRLPLQLIQLVTRASNALRAAGKAATPTTGQLTTPTMRSQAVGLVLSSANIRVRLVRPLSGKEVNEVALSIFKTLSIAFEAQQIWTDIVGKSAFAQEDLPSNLIGFYMAVRGFNRQAIMTSCKGLSVSGSVAEYTRNSSFVRNRSFNPIGATGSWPAELSTINDRAGAALYQTQRIATTQGLGSFTFCPMYRVVGTIGETDLFIVSFGGKRFTAADDLRVVPTYRSRPTMNGRYGHVSNIHVRPARPSDEAKFRLAGLTRWPVELPEPVLQCLPK